MLKPVGRIFPEGWIKEHLRRDKEGITGNLGRLCPDASGDIFCGQKVHDVIKGSWSSWWPGETEGAWREAYVRLAFALDDPDLKAESAAYIERVLAHQEENGYIGIFVPEERFGNGARSGELWTQSRIMAAMIVYYEQTCDPRILTALERLADLIVRQYGPLGGGRSLFETPDEDGSKAHSLMVAEPLLWLYERLEKPEYLEFCVFLYRDYSSYAPRAPYPCFDLSSHMAADPGAELIGHGPHTCEQLRIPLLLYRFTGQPDYLALFRAAYAKLLRCLSLSGSCKSDELIGIFRNDIPKEERSGLNFIGCFPLPELGYEYCSTTELMFSFDKAACVTGDLSYADREEWLLHNAAMAARQQDGKAILYLSADNLYEATRAAGDRWDYSPTHEDAAVCCAPNSGKIMPYHLGAMWKQDERGALYAVYFGPCVLDTVIGGNPVRIRQETRYPFENSVRFHMETGVPVPLHIRVPGWCEKLSVTGADGEIPFQIVSAGGGRCCVPDIPLRQGSGITVTFHARPVLLTAADGTKAAAMGPLLYALDIPADREATAKYALEPFCDFDVTPASGANWSYTLLDAQGGDGLMRPEARESPGHPWDIAPARLRVKMLTKHGLPEWVELVPLGCTDLRRTTFPSVLRKDYPCHPLFHTKHQ